MMMKQSRAMAPLATRRSAVAARPVRHGKGAGRRASVVVRAEEDSQVEVVVKQLAEKWDKVENKTGVILYSAGAVTAVWFSSTIVGAVNTLPLVPKLFELVGLGYTAWFVYRYLLFQSSRDELVKDVDDLKKKITGGDL
ncbi:MAG: CAAD domains of cyanobacterial aminoacyl-tRNA synthetase-domain-containing protein [Monoraphidium minutum]|nr:MAG: CAAD domains of cyanobacterial aminoacyl-tRNA synthetase-domain-containing protein [Monoraphidium minutum]